MNYSKIKSHLGKNKSILKAICIISLSAGCADDVTGGGLASINENPTRQGLLFEIDYVWPQVEPPAGSLQMEGRILTLDSNNFSSSPTRVTYDGPSTTITLDLSQIPGAGNMELQLLFFESENTTAVFHSRTEFSYKPFDTIKRVQARIFEGPSIADE